MSLSFVKILKRPLLSVTVTLLDEVAADSEVIFILDGVGTGQLENVFENVAPGDHTIEMIAPNGCALPTEEFTIDAIENLEITAFDTNLNEFGVEAVGGVPPYEFFLDGVSQGTETTYHINRTDTYVVRVVDSNGCEAIVEMFVEFIDIVIPPVFTPDNDGIGDEWRIINDEGFPNIVTKVYDRYGRWLGTLKQGETWKGLYDGSNLPTGDYWYVVKINGENDPREFVGHFTLYR